MKILKSFLIAILSCLSISSFAFGEDCPSNLETGGSIVVSGDILIVQLTEGDEPISEELCTILFDCQMLEYSDVDDSTNTYYYNLAELELEEGLYIAKIISLKGATLSIKFIY